MILIVELVDIWYSTELAKYKSVYALMKGVTDVSFPIDHITFLII